MNVMTKRGSQDNVVTYEHYCDTKEDLTAIPNDQITLGSTAVVLKDEGDAMGVYMANSSKEWIPFSSIGNANDGSGGDSTGGVMIVHATYDESEGGIFILNKTFQEIQDAMESTCVMIITTEDINGYKIVGNCFCNHAGYDADYEKYYVSVEDGYFPNTEFETTSASGYPTMNAVIIDGGDDGEA